MRDFLEGLEANAQTIITEAAPLNEAESGQTFAEAASGAKWAYIPQPKGASDADLKAGKNGFGSAKNTLLLIKENSPDSWDIVVFKKSAGGGGVGSTADKSAADALRKRGTAPKTEEPKTEAQEIAKYMALTEQVLSGKAQRLDEAAGNVEGWKAALSDDSWKSTKVLGGLKFADLLEKCVAVVSPKDGGSKSFLN